MRLVYRGTRKEVEVNDEVMVGHELTMVTGIAKPHKPSSTGRVSVHYVYKGFAMEYYPSVIGAEWIEREDI